MPPTGRRLLAPYYGDKNLYITFAAFGAALLLLCLAAAAVRKQRQLAARRRDGLLDDALMEHGTGE